MMKTYLLLFLLFALPAHLHAATNTARKCEALARAAVEFNVRDTVAFELPKLLEILSQPEGQVMMNRSTSYSDGTKMFWDMFDMAERGQGIIKSIVRSEDEGPIGFLFVYPSANDRRSGVVAYSLDSRFWSRGILTGALQQIVGEAFEKNHFNAIEAYVAVSNIGSQRVLEKSGFTQTGRIADFNPRRAFRREEVFTYRLDRPGLVTDRSLFLRILNAFRGR